jgi:hypothetical protein
VNVISVRNVHNVGRGHQTPLNNPKLLSNGPRPSPDQTKAVIIITFAHLLASVSLLRINDELS